MVWPFISDKWRAPLVSELTLPTAKQNQGYSFYTHLKVNKKIIITVILQFLKKFALFIFLIIGPEIMIKSVVTPLLPYILIFKLEVLGKRASL